MADSPPISDGELATCDVQSRNGLLATVWTLPDGSLHGLEERYADDERKTVLLRIPWDSNRIHGLVEEYYPDGVQLRRTIYFVHGVAHGDAFSYRKDGSLLTQIPWVNGRRHGVAKMFTDDDRPIRRAQYANGELIREFPMNYQLDEVKLAYLSKPQTRTPTEQELDAAAQFIVSLDPYAPLIAIF